MSTLLPSQSGQSYLTSIQPRKGSWHPRWSLFLAASFLVSVPVFLQAPLVRVLPLASLAMVGGWAILALILMERPSTRLWGDLLWGFSWSWLAGSLYWGWLRWEPLAHLPVESIGLPFALWSLRRGWAVAGHLFYLGSLVGTAITDVYFYLVGLIPHWRQLMQVEPALAAPIFQSAIARVQTPWGIGWAAVLTNLLLVLGLWSLQKRQCQWQGFAGAVLSTLVVDGLFFLAACLA